MKHLVYGVLFLSLGFLGYWLFFSNSESITNYPSNRTTIVAFGDSLVKGVGSTPGNDFVSLLATEINSPIINRGQSGDTTRDGLARIDSVLAENPKIVILLLGGNDFLQKIPPEETFQNLGTMIEKIHQNGAMVLLLGVRGGLLSDSYQKEYKSLAQSYNTAYVPDVLDGVFGHSSLMSDPIHPNDAGYKIIAEKVTPVLIEIND